MTGRTPTVAIIGAGEMGAAVGQQLAANGVRVITCLAGRSPATAARAKAAGFETLPDDAAMIAAADCVLSILPPDHAVALAERLAPALAAITTPPIYVDCNAVAPATAIRIANIVTRTGAAFVDGGIVGPAPLPDSGNTRIYLSGEHATTVAAYARFGVDFRAIDGGIGAASALKMCFASLTKGATALAIQAFTAARSHGVASALRDELAVSKPDVLKSATQQSLSLGRKAYRWIGEMEEIAATFGAVGLSPRIFEDVADIYRAIDASPIGRDRDRSDAPPSDLLRIAEVMLHVLETKA